jgi:hypothetical protein
MTAEEQKRALEGGQKQDLPPGFYKVMVDSFRFFNGSDRSQDKALILTLRVIEGDYADCKMDEWITSHSPGNDTKVRMAREQSVRISNAIWGTTRSFRGSDLVDKVFGINRVASKKDGKEYKNNYVCSLDEYEKKKNLPVKPPVERNSKPAAATAPASTPAAKGSEFSDGDVPFS